MKLLLFDIDGTLLVSNGAGRRAMKSSLPRILNLDSVNLEGIDFGGRTDPQIIRDILLTNGIDAKDVDDLLPDALEAYVTAFQANFQDDYVTALSGAIDLIEALSEMDHIQLAVLTGNVHPTAYTKLEAIGVAEYFPFGAFGSDHADRYQLPEIALQRALDHNGHNYVEKNIVIIGDTKHDILCGRHLNVFSVAVSTGHYHADDLSNYGPDLLLENLSNIEKFIELVV